MSKHRSASDERHHGRIRIVTKGIVALYQGHLPPFLSQKQYVAALIPSLYPLSGEGCNNATQRT